MGLCVLVYGCVRSLRTGASGLCVGRCDLGGWGGVKQEVTAAGCQGNPGSPLNSGVPRAGVGVFLLDTLGPSHLQLAPSVSAAFPAQGQPSLPLWQNSVLIYYFLIYYFLPLPP